MPSITLNDVLNFCIPIGVWLFLIWIIYRIPIIQQGVDKLAEKIRDLREGKTTDSTVNIKTLQYE